MDNLSPEDIDQEVLLDSGKGYYCDVKFKDTWYVGVFTEGNLLETPG
jgi:hypothetical protein